MKFQRGILGHVSKVHELGLWDAARWPSLRPEDYACHHCGEFFWDEQFYDAAQQFSEEIKVNQLVPNSGHRCPVHNAAEGGAPLSWHKIIAQDISIRIAPPAVLLAAARKVGFRGFGYYPTFLHMDLRPRPTFWYVGKGGERTWKSLVTF